MRLSTACRILAERSLKEKYWDTRATCSQLVRLVRPSNRHFAYVVGRDYLRFLLGTVRPIMGETRERARAAAKTYRSKI
jgi:hypothetical protein